MFRAAGLICLFAALTCCDAAAANEANPRPKPTLESAEGVEVPPAPFLPPQEAMKTFTIADGFRLELVAAEPLLEDPVVIAFDADGRLWAAEMIGYMRDADATGELDPTGRIVALDDVDGDGRMDKRTVFMEGLVLPRAVLPVMDGALVAAPPNLWFCRDTDGDGKADEQIDVATNYGRRGDNPEHSANGLTYGVDNWIHSANYSQAFQFSDGKWTVRSDPQRGQWGLSRDDWGRFFHNTNSDYLRADLVPSHYFSRNGNYPEGRNTGINAQVGSDQAVFPSRATYAVNRGYQDGVLRPDGRLKNFTAACAPLIYRGGLYPEEFAGNAFVCEPSAHLVRRSIVQEQGIELKAQNAYKEQEKEFLTSTDERFRPVNLTSGPDGTIYLLDMYRGIIQHKGFLTPYLRQLLLRREMDKPIGVGRVYRIVHESTQPRKPVKMSKLTSDELVGMLSQADGFVRDTAQRLLVERQDTKVAGALESLAREGADPRARVQALWTLEGLGAHANAAIVALSDEHPWVRATGIRLVEVLPPEPARDHLWPLANDPDPVVRVQFAYTVSAMRDTKAMATLAGLLAENGDDRFVRDAAVNGLHGAELEMIEVLLDDDNWQREQPGQGNVYAALAGCVLRERTPERVQRLLDLAAAQEGDTSWRQVALLKGMGEVAARADQNPKVEPILFEARPHVLNRLTESKNEQVRQSAAHLAAVITWPGKAVIETKDVRPLTEPQQALFEQGKTLFGASCAACHQASGEGQAGKAPPLLGSQWVLGPEQRLARIVLHGVRGPITVNGETLNMEMPSLSAYTDDQIAAILTYVRREWGHTADPVESETVKSVREATKDRTAQWTEEELLKVQ